MEGIKKSEVKNRIREKCERSRAFYYDHRVNYKRLNKIVETAWKKEVPLREIRQVEIAQEVLDWFLCLEDSVILTDEEVEAFKVKRPKISIKKNKPINWNRTKYLFTLYIWTKVQQNYLDKPNMHYLKKYNKRFQEDADLKPSFSMQRERDFLYDLGYININYALGIDAKFIENEVFNTEITDKNRIVISGEDLYKCGYWLEKQKMGSFVCQHCGKEFAHYTKSRQEKGRKYCKQCAKIVANDVVLNLDYKIIKCIDCGEVFKVSKKDTKTCRCDECQEKNSSEKHRLRQQKYREKLKSDATNPILNNPSNP